MREGAAWLARRSWRPRPRPAGTSRTPRRCRPSPRTAMTPSSVNFWRSQPGCRSGAGVEQAELLAVRARSWRRASAWKPARSGEFMTSGSTVLHVEAHALPHLLLQEAVAHAHGGLEGELLALAQLGGGELLVVVLQAEHAEGDVAGLVAHHVAQQLLEQRLGGELVDEAEGGEGEALDHDLHAEVGHVPAAVGDDVVEQQPQVGVDRVVARQLGVEVLGEDLDVAGLVHHLGGGVVLGVDPRHGLDDLAPCRRGRPARRA